MKSGELQELARHMVVQANSFADYRRQIAEAFERRRELNMNLLVGAVAGQAISVMALSPAAAAGFTAAALVAIGNAFRHKSKGAQRLKALCESRLPVLGADIESPGAGPCQDRSRL